MRKSKSNVEVFRLLADAMGFEESVFKETEEEMITAALDYTAESLFRWNYV